MKPGILNKIHRGSPTDEISGQQAFNLLLSFLLFCLFVCINNENSACIVCQYDPSEAIYTPPHREPVGVFICIFHDLPSCILFWIHQHVSQSPRLAPRAEEIDGKICQVSVTLDIPQQGFRISSGTQRYGIEIWV